MGILCREMGEWRASLEDPHSQEMRIFADLEDLFDFLLRETERQTSGDDVRLGEAGDVS